MKIENNLTVEKFKNALEKLSVIDSVDHITIESGFIKSVRILTRLSGPATVLQLQVDDAERLFEFYYAGLSEKSRELFFPYPLFDTATASVDELKERIMEWKKENTWSFFNLYKDDEIIGVSFLKKINTAFPTSGIAIRDKCHNVGFGTILQNLVIEQAKIFGVKKLYVKVDPSNTLSKLLQEKCGYKYWSITSHFGFENGIKVLRSVIEMTCDI